MMADYDVTLDLSMVMVIRGAKNKRHAREIAKALADQFAGVSEEIDGSAYGQPLVTAFSIHNLGEEIDVEKLADGE